MQILGIDTSGKVAAAAILETDTNCFLAQQMLYTKRTHSQVILPLAERLLFDTEKTWQDIDGIAVANGPGSYTGLRIGIAAVKALAFGLNIPCMGISTLEGLAWQCQSWKGVICPVMFARQMFVYTGIYQSDGNFVTQIESDSILEVAVLQEKLAQYRMPVLVTGDGADMLELSEQLIIASPAVRLQNGTGICLASAAQESWQKPENLMPEYLQLVKAEKDLKERRKQIGLVENLKK